MRLSPPKQITFLASLIAFAAGVAGNYVSIPYVSEYAFFILAGSYALLALGNMLKGL